MSTHQVLLLLGSGANVGAHVVRKFAANGFKVASASRTAQVQDRVDLHVQCDLSDPDSVIEVFNEVTRTLGPPSVVVYNAAAATLNSAEDPLSLDVKTLNRDFQINTASVLVAAREATKAFDNLPPTASRTFIYTGNILNASPMAPLLGLGIGKSATAHLIASASMAYKLKGYKFFYADERNADGSPAYEHISGAAHGDFYAELASRDNDVPWLATFVKDKGYVDFIREK